MLLSGVIGFPLRRLAQWERKRNGIADTPTCSDEDMKPDVFIKPQELVGM